MQGKKETETEAEKERTTDASMHVHKGWGKKERYPKSVSLFKTLH